MDRSLDEIIAERPQKQNQNRGRRSQGQGRRRDGGRKSYRDERVDLDHDWVHDKYEDDRETRPSRAPRRPRGDRYSPSPEYGGAQTGAKLRVENIHYDITESDLEDLFGRIGPVTNLSLVFDRAGRSEGLAFVTYSRLSDARTAISEFDGANAKGQPIRLSLISTNTSSGGGRGRGDRDRYNPFDNVERPKGSLMDRIERPRDARSLSPGSRSDSPDGAGAGGRRRRGGGGGGGAAPRYRRSDVSKPPPEHIDRYVPGQRTRSPVRRGPANTNGGRRGQGGGGGGRGTNGTSARQPQKTKEELDAEMDDYWGGSTNPAAPAEGAVSAEQQQQEQQGGGPAADDDIDMIE